MTVDDSRWDSRDDNQTIFIYKQNRSLDPDTFKRTNKSSLLYESNIKTNIDWPWTSTKVNYIVNLSK